MRTSAWPGPGTGSGIDSKRSTSAPPNSWKTSACTDHLFRFIEARIVSACSPRWRRGAIAPWSARQHQDRAEVVDVGQRGPGDHRVAEVAEEGVRVVRV